MFDKKKINFTTFEIQEDVNVDAVAEKAAELTGLMLDQEITPDSPVKARYYIDSCNGGILNGTVTIVTKAYDKKALKKRLAKRVEEEKKLTKKRLSKDAKEAIKKEILKDLYATASEDDLDIDFAIFIKEKKLIISKKETVGAEWLSRILGTIYAMHPFYNLKHMSAALTNLYAEEPQESLLGRYEGNICVSFEKEGEEEEAPLKKAKFTGPNPSQIETCLENIKEGEIVSCTITLGQYILCVSSEADKISAFRLASGEKIQAEDVLDFLNQAAEVTD